MFAPIAYSVQLSVDLGVVRFWIGDISYLTCTATNISYSVRLQAPMSKCTRRPQSHPSLSLRVQHVIQIKFGNYRLSYSPVGT